MAEETVSIEITLDAKLKEQMAGRAAGGFPAIEKFLYDAAMGKVKEAVVVDEFKEDPESGKKVRCKVVRNIAPCVKDRVGAAKAWKELVVDKRAADKKESPALAADKGAASVTGAIRAVAEKKREAALKLLQGGKT